MEELRYLGSLAVEILFKQSDTWCDFVRNFMVSIVEFFPLCTDK